LIFYSIGFLLSLFIKSARTANIVTSGFFIAMLFTSGVVLPLDSLPDYVKFCANLLPMSHSIAVMQLLWIGEFTNSISYLDIVYLLVIGCFLLILLRTVKIRWE